MSGNDILNATIEEKRAYLERVLSLSVKLCLFHLQKVKKIKEMMKIDSDVELTKKLSEFLGVELEKNCKLCGSQMAFIKPCQGKIEFGSNGYYECKKCGYKEIII